MHSIFNDVVEIVRANNDPWDDSASFERVLTDTLANLSEENREGAQVSGSDFWLSGPKGAAGTFSSSAGRRVLTHRLKSTLPKIQ
jgi:hypothetical protein